MIVSNHYIMFSSIRGSYFNFPAAGKRLGTVKLILHTKRAVNPQVIELLQSHDVLFSLCIWGLSWTTPHQKIKNTFTLNSWLRNNSQHFSLYLLHL